MIVRWEFGWDVGCSALDVESVYKKRKKHEIKSNDNLVNDSIVVGRHSFVAHKAQRDLRFGLK